MLALAFWQATEQKRMLLQRLHSIRCSVLAQKPAGSAVRSLSLICAENKGSAYRTASQQAQGHLSRQPWWRSVRCNVPHAGGDSSHRYSVGSGLHSSDEQEAVNVLDSCLTLHAASVLS